MSEMDGPYRVLCVGTTDAIVASLDDEFEVVTEARLTTVTDRLESGPIDCVVTAFDLPDGDGFDLLSAVRELRPDVPVILAPQSGSEQLASESIEAGLDGYYPTDGDGQSLVEMVTSAIERHRTRLQSLDRMTDAFHVLDTEWRITYINDRAREILHEAMPADERDQTTNLHGKRLWDVVPDAVDTPFYEKYTEAMRTQEAVTFEEYYEPLGRWFEVRAYPSSTGLSVYFRDVTKRKAYEERLQRRESLLTRIHRVTADKDRSFEQKVGELLDIGREELGTTYGSLSRLEGNEYYFEVVRSAEWNDELSAGDRVPLRWTSCERAVTTEETLVIADMERDAPDLLDRQGNVELGLGCYLGAPVMVDGEVTGTFCFYGPETRAETFSQWQVTLVELLANWISYERERKQQSEMVLRERNRLEKFASIVSHDLRNPLNIATANLELLADDCDSEYVENVGGALTRMDELIDDVLTLARLGKEVVDAEPLELSTLSQQAWGTVSTTDGDLVVDESATVVGDATRLQRLFENLFRNSVEHSSTDSRTQSDDSVEHGDSSVTVRVGPLDDGRGFYVEDDGPGIPEDNRETVFDHGYTTDTNGTGFGLSIVEQIVEAHGGAVTVTDSESGGARFEIRKLEVR
jgi:signal transduction histidine kinase/DNA-binding NarL/FixJ family response regulator